MDRWRWHLAPDMDIRKLPDDELRRRLTQEALTALVWLRDTAPDKADELGYYLNMTDAEVEAGGAFTKAWEALDAILDECPDTPDWAYDIYLDGKALGVDDLLSFRRRLAERTVGIRMTLNH